MVNSTRIHFSIVALLALAGGAEPCRADDAATLQVPAHGVIGVDAAKLTPEFWIARLQDPDRVIFDPTAIATRNENLVRVDATMHDLSALPQALSRKQITEWIQSISKRPTRPMFDSDGKPVTAQMIDVLIDNLALSAIAESEPTRYGLVVHRADLRKFPSALRAYSRSDDRDIDRFQETALFPGTAVVIAHQSADKQWLFVISPRYAAWVEGGHIAEGIAAEVLAYADKIPYRIVTGPFVATVHTPEQPAVSELRLDMGTRIPVLADWPASEPVNGQHPYTSHVIELPVREADGKLKLQPALLQKNTDTQGDYLLLTRANVLRQAFKFLGERYGWGHSHNGRDCSGFVSDVYSSMGVRMPRNTRDQSVSAGLDHRSFGAGDDRQTRLAAARALEVGDLVYIPGHVMMTIGSIDGVPYVIHDTTGLSYRGHDGARVHVDLDEVSVSPLTPLLFNDTQTYIDRMTSIVRIRPAAAKEAPAKP
jgi:hypothetical protein